MIDGQKINLWVLHVLCSPTNYDRVRGAYSTKFYLARLRSKVQSAVKCENAKQFYEKEFLQGMWGPCVYDCLIQLFNSPAKTTIFTFLEVIFIHSIYSSSYPKKKQRKDPTKSEKKSLVRKVLAHCLLMSDHFATVHCKNTRAIRPDPQLVHKLFSLHNVDLTVNYGMQRS